MALSPYRDSHSPVYRSRSSSLSSPSSRNFLYQEVFEIGGNALVRSYSCGQVFAKDKNGQTIQATQVRISNFISPSKNCVNVIAENTGKSWSVPRKLPIEYSMGKKSKSLKSKISLQFTDAEKPIKAEGDGGTRSSQLSDLIWRNGKKTVYLHLIILTLFSAICLYRYKHCNQHWDTQVIANKLKHSVFGQEVAITKIESVLTTFNESHESAILCFTGSIGVGKTFASSIIYDNFPWISNEYINFFDSDTEEMLRSKRYSSCGVNLIVIDGISVLDADKAGKCFEYLLDTHKAAKFLVILIFQTQNFEEEEFVMRHLKNTKKNIYHVPFKNLQQEEVEKCFNAELKRQKKFITQEKLNELLREHMKFCDISKSFQGCKNVFHEVSLLSKND